ncbi:MAG: hypothetical protein M3165_01870 [Actinomycetota bacterium]|nr:hypothetical protein [Actinomycetota bacterium]
MSDFGAHGPGDHGAGGPGFSRPGAHQDAGSVGEEAAKLLAALQGWAREHASDYSRAASGFGSAYISDGSAACRLCPVCQLIAFVRGINPESLDQLSQAAGSMLHALAGLVEAAQRSDARRGSPVQKIDLADDSADGPGDAPWH